VAARLNRDESCGLGRLISQSITIAIAINNLQITGSSERDEQNTNKSSLPLIMNPKETTHVHSIQQAINHKIPCQGEAVLMSSCCPVVCEGAWCGEESLRRWSTTEKPIKVDLHPGFSMSKVRIRGGDAGGPELCWQHTQLWPCCFSHTGPGWEDMRRREREGAAAAAWPRNCGYSQTGRVILQCREGELREMERRPPIRQSRSHKRCC
jgi:hypothetical protein